ncbi:hypothetical protein CHS0354_034072 [Potamilus streckersoni]|uniref:TM2 domain-containing protein n=1 Tax=Potamilus streckersoni TaxID=2493646 RepID=A0AAE0RV19_9BIVA|nr:hypothetical protein CHS0354_034072 [Potamilus streckersoni]
MEKQQISNEDHSQREMANSFTADRGQNFPNRIPLADKKSVVDAYILGIVFGCLGAHHFYLRRIGFGVLYFFTFGLFGVGYLIDLFRMPYLVALANKEIADPKQRNKANISDAYVLWFPCGIFGFHHFYLKNPGLGMLYFFTLGVFGIGWIIDLFRIPSLVEEHNSRDPSNVQLKSVGAACVFTISPLGLLGSHHFYLGNIGFGLTYFFTFGLLGIGWIVDWFRVCILVQRANNAIKNGPDNRKYVDEAYVLWFPLGVLGLHHFYLNRPVWGILYFFTFGLVGIGWLIDGFRIPCLVKDANRINAEKGLIIVTPRQPIQQTRYPPASQTGYGTNVLTPPFQVVLSTQGYPVSGYNPIHYPYQQYATQYPPSGYMYPPGAGQYPPGALPNYSVLPHTGESNGKQISTESYGTGMSTESHNTDMSMDNPPPYSENDVKSNLSL